MKQQNLSQSILIRLQEPLTPEEKLWALNLPLEFRRQLTEMEGKMLVRLKPSEWSESLRERAEKHVDIEAE